jgi:alcohol dehydrogenase YqhD (iron-dependent ADH family)
MPCLSEILGEIMQDFAFQCKSKIIFGMNTESQIGEETGRYTQKVLLHYGQASIKETGLYDKVVGSLIIVVNRLFIAPCESSSTLSKSNITSLIIYIS